MILAEVGFKAIDLIIVVVYLVGIMVVGIMAGYRKGASSEQFFLAGKSLRWPMIGAALFTANISTIHLVGLSAAGFSVGLVIGNFEWMAAFCLIVLGLIFVPFYLRSGINTLPQFLEKRYSPTCRMILAFIAIWSAMLVHIGVSLFAGAKVFDYFFGIPVVVSITIIAVVTAIYTILGGLKAIVVTDTIQAVLLLGGCILLTILGICKLPEMGIHSFAQFKAATQPDQLSMVHTLRDAHGNLNQYSWLSVMIGYHVLGIWYWCTDQTIVQKTLGAKDMRHGQLGAIFAGCLKILPLFFMVLPGVLAYVLFKDQIDNPNHTLNILVDNLLPPVLKGLFAAGLLAAVMSTVEAALNSTATVTAEDICKHIWPKLKDKTLVLIGRITAVIVIILAIIWSPYCGKFESIFVVINKVPLMFAPAITTVFVLGVFWKRGTKQAALATFIAGVCVGLPYFLIDLPHDVAASEVQAPIQSYRVPAGNVVEEWVAAPATDMQSLIDSSGTPSDAIVSEWKAIPLSIRKAALKTERTPEDEAEKAPAPTEPKQPWSAVPLRHMQIAETGDQSLIQIWAPVPEADLQAARETGEIPKKWMVTNYGRINHGLGIPFMMMGLVLLSMCVVVYVVVTMLTPAPTAEQLEEMGWRPPLKTIFSEKLKGPGDTRAIALGLIVLVVVLYYFLR